jgi:hypothetical protein
VVIGSGASYDLSTDIGVADIGEISLGQQVDVTPDSTNQVVSGQVSAIGVVGTSGTTTSYPVTISLDSADLGQLSGQQAEASIIVKKAAGVLTVPSSAVRTVGSIHLVTVVDDNVAKSTRVGVGTVGAVLTQITSGLKKGQDVSLADMKEAVPSSSTTTSGFGGALGGASGFSPPSFGGGSGFSSGGSSG